MFHTESGRTIEEQLHMWNSKQDKYTKWLEEQYLKKMSEEDPQQIRDRDRGERALMLEMLYQDSYDTASYQKELILYMEFARSGFLENNFNMTYFYYQLMIQLVPKNDMSVGIHHFNQANLLNFKFHNYDACIPYYINASQLEISKHDFRTHLYCAMAYQNRCNEISQQLQSQDGQDQGEDTLDHEHEHMHDLHRNLQSEMISRFKIAIYLFDKLDKKLFYASSCDNYNSYHTAQELESLIENGRELVQQILDVQMKNLREKGHYDKQLNLFKLSVYGGNIPKVLESYGDYRHRKIKNAKLGNVSDGFDDDCCGDYLKCARDQFGRLREKRRDGFCDSFAILGRCETCDERHFYSFPSPHKICEHSIAIEYFIYQGRYDTAINFVDYLIYKHVIGVCDWCGGLLSELYDLKARILTLINMESNYTYSSNWYGMEINYRNKKGMRQKDENIIQTLYKKSIKVDVSNRNAYHNYSLFFLKFKQNYKQAKLYHLKAIALTNMANVKKGTRKKIKFQKNSECAQLKKYYGKYCIHYGAALYEYIQKLRDDNQLHLLPQKQVLQMVFNMKENLTNACNYNPNLPFAFEMLGYALTLFPTILSNPYNNLKNGNGNAIKNCHSKSSYSAIERAFCAYARTFALSSCEAYYYYSFTDYSYSYHYNHRNDRYDTIVHKYDDSKPNALRSLLYYYDMACCEYTKKIELQFQSPRDLCDNPQLLQKYGFSSFGGMFCLTGLLDLQLFMHLLKVLEKHAKKGYTYYDKSSIVRIIRTALMLFAKSIDNSYSDNNIMLDGMYFKNLSMIAIGVLSFYTLDIDSIDKYKCYTSNKFSDLKLFLKRFVINYIEKYYFHLLEHNQNNCKIETVESAIVCLYVSYWIIGDKNKMFEYYNKHLATPFVSESRIDKYDITPDRVDLVDQYKFDCVRRYIGNCQEFALEHTRLNMYENDKPEDSGVMSNKIERLIHCVINPQTRNDTLHLKFRNVVQNRKIKQCNFCQTVWNETKLKKCKGCKRVSYCSKKCQKCDWVDSHRNYCQPYD